MNASWPQVPLGELLAEQKVRVGVFDANGLPLLGVSNTLGLHRTEKPRIADMSRYLRVDHGWFAYNPMRINVGSIGWAERPEQTGVISPDYVVFSCTDRIEPRLLYPFLRSAVGLRAINLETAGSVRERLYFDSLARIRFPLPCLAEQRRIVARIEELAAKINEAMGLRKRTVPETEALVTGEATKVLETLMEGPRQPIRSLGEEGLNPIQIGPFGAQLHRSDFVETGVPVLNVGNVWLEGLRLDDLDRVSEEKAKQLSRYSIKSGDLLFARSGATLGKVCLVPSQCDGWLMTGHLFRIRFDRKRVLDRFAFAAFSRSRQIQKQVFGQVRGATRPGYNTTLLGMVELPVPPLCVQRLIVEQLDAVQKAVEALKKLQAETAAELDALLPSILDRAFRGEL